ncbi:MAG TPA: translocation/assembly module TamB domain-containing protein [Terracidiphilus sp.]|nr:translocation/assembly module TamB domain-containing protein [Terracidiphilus sp.]
MSEAGETRVRPRRRWLWWAGGGALLLILLASLGVWLTSDACENLVRKTLISKLATATGGRVEIASFQWHPFDLEAEAGGIVIHGKERASESPYARVDRVRVAISILGFLSPKVRLRSLDIARPQMHLIVYPDGTTNQPQPRKQASSGKSGLDTFFDLKAGLLTVEDGVFDFENRAAKFDFQNRLERLNFKANDVSLRLAYVTAAGANPESYHVEMGARDFTLSRGTAEHPLARPVEGFMQATVDLTRNAAYLRSLRLTAHSKGIKDRTLEVSGMLADFSHPRWQAIVKGDLDMRLLEPITGYPNTPEGLAHLDLTGEGHGGIFRGDGTVHADGAAYVGTGVNARGITLDAKVHADAEQLRITSVTAKLRAGGQITGDVLLDNWLGPLPGGDVMQAAPPEKKKSRSFFHRKSKKTPAEEPAITQAERDRHVNGRVDANFKSVTLDTILDMVSMPPFQRLGLASFVNGPALALWSNGDVNTLSVNAKLSLNSPVQPVNGEVPASGAVDATYTQKDGAVAVRQLEVSLPLSHVQASGQIGAYPLSSPTSIVLDAESRNVREFDQLLRDLGLERNGKSGSSALPVSFKGEALFHGTWTGSLIRPHLSGALQASNLDAEMPRREGQPDATPQVIHIDSVDATGSYAPTRISIDHAQIKQDDAEMEMSGTLTAATPPVAPSNSKTTHKQAMPHVLASSSLLHAQLRAKNITVEKLLPLLGKNLPVTGKMNAQVEANGELRTLSGSGWVELNNGTLYGEPLSLVRAEGSMNGENVRLTSFNVKDDAGMVSGSGSYDLKTKQFQVSAQSPAINLGQLQKLKHTGVSITGISSFLVTGNGTVDDPHLQATATMDKVAIGGEALGRVQLTAHTAHQSLLYNLTTSLDTATVSAHGQTELKGDYTTQATLNFSKFDIGALLKLAHVQGLTGQSSLAGTVTAAGPLKHPDQMHGEARLNELAATIEGVHLNSEGGLHATLANGRVSLDPLHITGEETDLHIEGGVTFKDKRPLDLKAQGSINLKLAETIDPDLSASGTTTFQVEAHGSLENPGLRGRIEFKEASLALEDLPNSLSHLTGTLEFNQNRLEVRSLTATSGGGQLSVGGYLAYQHGIFANLTLTGKGIRIRYPQGVSSQADAKLQLQGPQKNLLLSGNILITRFTVSPDLDFVALASQATKVQPIAPPDAPSNHVRLDVHIVSSPQLNFQNAFAKLAGDVDLHLRGTVATPSLLGRISITEGSATIAGTRYELQRGDITFTNPVRIQPSIDLNATARVEDYDITLGLHGSPDKLNVSYRSDPPLPEQDVVALLALGRTENEQRIYTQQQEQLANNPATDALLGGALNATVSSRVQKLFGAGSVKVDPSYLGALGNSTTRITVEEQLGKNLTLTYATNVNTTAQQLLQAEIAINRHVSLLVARDESGVFSMVVKATRRYK